MAKMNKEGAAKKLSTVEGAAKKPRKPGQIVGVGTPGTTTYTGKPGVNKPSKKGQ